jgi:hypothetical protein
MEEANTQDKRIPNKETRRNKKISTPKRHITRRVAPYVIRSRKQSIISFAPAVFLGIFGISFCRPSGLVTSLLLLLNSHLMLGGKRSLKESIGARGEVSIVSLSLELGACGSLVIGLFLME